MKHYLQRKSLYFWLIVTIVAGINLLFVMRLSGLSYGAYSWKNYAGGYSVQLTSFTAYENETYVYGYVDTSNISVILTLKDSDGDVKSQVNTITDGTYFNAYFGSIIAGGDSIEVDLPNTPTITIDIPELSATINKANDTVTGMSPANRQISVLLFSYLEWQWYYAYPIANGSGDFTADFSADIDIFTGDGLELWYYDTNYYRTVRRDTRAHGFTVNPLYDSVGGYAEPGVDVNLTLKNSGGTVKAEETISANSVGYYYTNFTNPALVDIVVGDSVEVQYGSGAAQSIQVVDVTINSVNVTTDVVNGTAPANSKLEVYTYDSYLAAWGTRIVNANGAGAYTADFSTAAAHTGPDMLAVERAQQASQSARHLEAETAVPPTAESTTNDALWGTAAANQPAQLGEEANPEGITSPEDTTTPIDILPGSYASTTYHNAQDNEVTGDILYAGPYLKAYVGNYNYISVVGARNQAVQATLRNALGVVKGTATGSTGDDASAALYFYDSANTAVYPIGGDEIEVIFNGGATLTLDVAPLNFISDRDVRTVYGSAPPNQVVRILTDWGDHVGETTSDSSGHFSYTFSSRLTGGYGVEVYVRDGAGYDTIRQGYTPQFTVNPTQRYLSGYGPFETAVVATVLDNMGTPKETRSTTTNNIGWYSLSFSTDINTWDRIAVDAGPLHYEQDVIPLSIAADTTNNIVYGNTVPNGWLNVFDDTNFGPYSQYNYKYFYADNTGYFAAAFPEVHGGDRLEVLYWADGAKDRVELVRYAPALYINHALDTVSGYVDLDETGTVTIRNSSGVVKASASVTASNYYGSFSYTPDGVDIVPGDQVQVQFPSLNQTSAVIPMSGALNTTTDTVSGASLPNDQIGIEAYHWLNTYYTSYAGNDVYLRDFAATNASGNFMLDFSAAADLQTGDYAQLFYLDEDDTHYNTYLYTTNPTIAVTDYPTAVQPNNLVQVVATIANGAHVQYLYLRWDVESHADDNAYGYWSTWQQGIIGNNLASFIAPSGGAVYFKVMAYVDGRVIWSDEHTIDVNDTSATTLYEPVSGTTNDATPTIQGVTAPDAAVTLYKDNVSYMTTTANMLGYFSFNVSPALTPGTYNFYAVSTVNGDTGPDSNTVHLTIDPTLPVDPVHILITTAVGAQHLRDASGYANLGGRIWTRTGETIGVSIPISYTDVYSADLYVGGLFATNLLDSGDNTYVGTYLPPTNGSYQLVLKFRGGAPGDPVQTITILTGLIDPDGYVYDAELGEDYRVAGAVVTCYQLIDETNNIWGVWNAAVWNQINPQTVGADGYYAFFTLPGKYKVFATAPGYWDYESPILTVVDEPVHHNVALQRIYASYLPVITQP